MAKIPKHKYLLLNGNKMAKFMKSVFALGIIVLLFSFNSCSNSQYSDIEESIDNGSGSQGNKLAKQLIGTWKIKNNSATYSYFENGEGLYENRNSNGAIFWKWYKWEVTDSIITLNYEADGYSYTKVTPKKFIISYLETGNCIQYEYENGKKGDKWEYTKINNLGTSDIKYNSTPYESYIRIWGYYYPIHKAVMRCFHSTGTEANEQYLQFFGEIDLFNPAGAYLRYATPYYEGIDSYWRDGTYRISSSNSYWVYNFVYAKNNASYKATEGSITIKTANQLRVIDWRVDNGDCIGHFVGTFQ